MAEARYDVAIVGGSLAGSAAATFFGRAGLKVALLERHPDPKTYKRLCTTLIQASAVPTIRRLGLDGPIEAAGGLRTGAAMWTRWGWIRDTLGTEFGYDIRVGANVSVTPVANFYFGSDGDMTENGTKVFSSLKHNVFDFGLGITFH